MRSIILFQTFVNIVLGAALVFLLGQVDSKVGDMAGLEITAAHHLDETLRMNELLTEILAAVRQNGADRAASVDPSVDQ